MSRELSPFEANVLKLIDDAREERDQAAADVGRAVLAVTKKRWIEDSSYESAALRDEADGLGRRIRRLARYPHLADPLGRCAVKVTARAEHGTREYGPNGRYHVTYSGRRIPAVATPMMLMSKPEELELGNDRTATIRDGYVFSVPDTHTFYKHLVIEHFVVDEEGDARLPVDTYEIVPDYAKLDVGYRIWHGDAEAIAQRPRTAAMEYPEDAYALPLGLITQARAQLKSSQPELSPSYGRNIGPLRPEAAY